MKHPHSFHLCHSPVAVIVFAISMVTPRDFAQPAAYIAPLTEKRIETIDGHGMSRREYPFTKAGLYKPEWADPEAQSGKSPTVTHRPPIPYDSPEHPKNQNKRPTAPVGPSAPPGGLLYHKVSAGDTLSGISRRYRIPLDSIKRTNGLTSDLIRIGQTLRLELPGTRTG